MVPEPNDDFVRSYPSHPLFVATARRDLRNFARARGVATHDLDDISTAVGEVLIWIVGKKKRPGGFSLTARFFSNRVEIGIEGDDYRFGRGPAVRDPDQPMQTPRGVGM